MGWKVAGHWIQPPCCSPTRTTRRGWGSSTAFKSAPRPCWPPILPAWAAPRPPASRCRPRPSLIRVVSPNGGENYQAGSSQTISWTVANPSGLVQIDLYRGGVLFQSLAQVSVEPEQLSLGHQPLARGHEQLPYSTDRRWLSGGDGFLGRRFFRLWFRGRQSTRSLASRCKPMAALNCSSPTGRPSPAIRSCSRAPAAKVRPTAAPTSSTAASTPPPAMPSSGRTLI